MQWTWVTFPLLVLVFVGISVLMNLQFKGRRLRVNQVDLVDVDTRSAFVRGTTWAHVYSPETRAYNFRLQSQLAEGPTQESGSILSWQGLPGSGLGGLNRTTRIQPFTDPYAIVWNGRRSTEMSRVPIQVASTRSLIGRWWGSVALPDQPQLESTREGGLLRGEVSNPLPVELTDCMVLFGNWAYRLDRTGGRLAPGQTTRVDLERAFNLEWRLMRRRVRDTNDVTTPWDPTEEHVPRIMEIMMYHKAAGGVSYTQLTNRYQWYVDLTDHLTSGCAILWGRSEQRATELLLNGDRASDAYDQHWTFYRILFPVQQAASPNERSRP